MAEVMLTIQGRDYRIACDDGQEDLLRQRATYLDQRMDTLADQLGSMSDIRLMLLTSLLMTDDLLSAQEDAEKIRRQLQSYQSGAALTAAESAHLQQRLTKLETRLKGMLKPGKKAG